MKSQWKKIISMLLVLIASISLSGCSEVLDSIEKEIDGYTKSQNLGTTSAQSGSSETTKDSTTTDTRTSTQTGGGNSTQTSNDKNNLASIKVNKNGKYSSKMEVAAFLYQYGELPSNYLTKNKARDLGWDAQKGNLWKVTDKMSIGGDKFGNFEGLLPKKKGRQYYECDIDYRGGSRNAKRIVFSNDGLIFYTGDHYNSFEQLN